MLQNRGRSEKNSGQNFNFRRRNLLNSLTPNYWVAVASSDWRDAGFLHNCGSKNFLKIVLKLLKPLIPLGVIGEIQISAT